LEFSGGDALSGRANDVVRGGAPRGVPPGAKVG